MKNHMAIDQYGNTYHALGRHPRKTLMERLGRKRAEPMYRDKKDGRTVRVGWVIGGRWLSVYEVKPMEEEEEEV